VSAVPAQQPARILLGRIAGAHGMRGEVLVHTFTEAPENIGAYGALCDQAGVQQLKIKVVRVTPKGVIARVAGIADRHTAEALKGLELYVDRTRLPAIADDEFYHADLVGLAAVDVDGKVLGRIIAVHNFGAGDLLEIGLADTAKTELVPFSDAFVPQVDLTQRRAVVRLPATAGPDEDRGRAPEGAERRSKRQAPKRARPRR
jgi:16S rRNA processing protein RimM